MDIIRAYWPFLLPLFLIQVTLAVVSAVHVLRHPHYRFGNKVMWILIVCLVNIVGPIVYFAFGRGENT
jgi:hypothetical protein